MSQLPKITCHSAAKQDLNSSEILCDDKTILAIIYCTITREWNSWGRYRRFVQFVSTQRNTLNLLMISKMRFVFPFSFSFFLFFFKKSTIKFWSVVVRISSWKWKFCSLLLCKYLFSLFLKLKAFIFVYSIITNKVHMHRISVYVT